MTDAESASDDGRTDGDELTLRNRIPGLTAFQRDVLWVLARDGPTKDVMIKHALAGYYETSINDSRIHPNLDALEERGLVERRRRDGGTDEYELTERGEQELARRRAWQAVGNAGDLR